MKNTSKTQFLNATGSLFQPIKVKKQWKVAKELCLVIYIFRAAALLDVRGIVRAPQRSGVSNALSKEQ
jgi:hypothetical protein